MSQQPTHYNLLAVFNEEQKAEAAEAKLRKEGFGEDEVFRLASGTVIGSHFREHGPSHDRSALFLETRYVRPNPLTIVVLALIFALVLGVLVFVGGALLLVTHLAVLPEPSSGLEGGIVGMLLGAILGFTRRRQVRGAIGQNLSTGAGTASKERSKQETRMVVALRFPDPDNISRTSRARAILINNGGKLDRNVG